MSAPSPTKVVKIGVYLPAQVQLLDMAAIDIFGLMSKEYLSLLPLSPEEITESAPSIEIYYIDASASPAAGRDLLLTANASIRTTHSMRDDGVRPGQLDVVVLPGPDFTVAWSDETLSNLRGHAECGRTDILSICSASFICGAAGILKGKSACGPRGVQDMLREKYPDTNWVGHKYRWIQDGNIWSGGAVTNGNDLVSAYARATTRLFPPAVVEFACDLAEVGDRAREY